MVGASRTPAGESLAGEPNSSERRSGRGDVQPAVKSDSVHRESEGEHEPLPPHPHRPFPPVIPWRELGLTLMPSLWGGSVTDIHGGACVSLGGTRHVLCPIPGTGNSSHRFHHLPSLPLSLNPHKALINLQHHPKVLGTKTCKRLEKPKCRHILLSLAFNCQKGEAFSSEHKEEKLFSCSLTVSHFWLVRWQ